jgi:hypothetical protein
LHVQHQSTSTNRPCIPSTLHVQPPSLPFFSSTCTCNVPPHPHTHVYFHPLTNICLLLQIFWSWKMTMEHYVCVMSLVWGRLIGGMR